MLANIIRNAQKSFSGDPYYSAVSLMLSMDGTNGSTTFTDSSLNALTVTANGDAQISTSQSKYGGASGYFDGTGDYLSTPSTTVVAYGSGDYAMECWIYPTSTTFGRRIFEFNDAKDNLDLNLNGSGSISYYNGSTSTHSSSGIVATNAWSHIALVRRSGVVSVYVNGISVLSQATTPTTSSARVLYIGGFTNVWFQGYIDDLRISKFARYVSNFTPPTAALPTNQSSTVADPYYNYTSLLLHMDGADTSTNFVDSGPNALAVTASGDAKISTAQSKFGGASAYFDGAGDYLQISNNTAFDLPGDFTVEAWFYASNLASSPCIAGKWEANKVSWALLVGTTSVTFAVGNNGTYVASLPFSTTLTNNTWYHIAATRSGSSIKCFINGSQIGSTQTNSSNCSSTSIFAVGFLNSSSPAYFNGYIDDLRITKGVARTITVPTAPFPNIYNPNTTLPVTGAALWLDASQQNTLFTDAGTTPVTSSGQSIYQWNDLSGNNRHAIQATSGNRPTWTPPASGQNGLSVTSFNGIINYLVGGWQSYTDLTLFIVARNTSASSPGGRIFSQSDSVYADNVQTPTTTWIPAAFVSGPAFLSTDTSQNGIMSVSFTNNTYQRFIHRKTGTTGSNTVGSITATGTIGTVTRVMTRFCLGRNTNGTDGNWAGQICEIIAYPRQLTSGEESSVNNYLNSKWGTP